MFGFAAGLIVGLAATVVHPPAWPVLALPGIASLFAIQVVTLDPRPSVVIYKRRSLLLPARGIEIERGRFAVRAHEDHSITEERPNHVEVLGSDASGASDDGDRRPLAFECDSPREAVAWINRNLDPNEDRDSSRDELPSARLVIRRKLRS
jgi:hypothetical protein